MKVVEEEKHVLASRNPKGKRAHFWDKSLGGASNASSLARRDFLASPIKTLTGI